MSFEKRYTEIVAKTNIPPKRHLWLNTTIASIIAYLVIFAIIYIQRGSSTIKIINASTAWVAVIFIGFSMLLSGLCYFWNFIDNKIVYRKQIGIVGFTYALLHGFISLFFLSDHPFPEYYLADENILSFTFAVLATIYFAFMVVISNNFAVKELGPKKWRGFLRFGYIAYIFAIFHFGLKGFPWWVKWLQNGMQGAPPIGLILFLFALFVPYFRLVLEIDLRRRK